MSNKIIKKGVATQDQIIEGVTKAVDAIKTTMGPAGKCVAINGLMGPEITRDGATVAKSISFSDEAMNIGAQLVRKAAAATEESCGDNTSSTALLISEFCTKGQKAIKSGTNVNELKSGMLKASNWVKNYINQIATPIDGDLEKVRKVATISANNDPEIGDLVVDCMSKVGIDGIITADLSSGLETRIDVTTGMKIERGWASPHYITSQEDGLCVFQDPYVLVIGETISSVQQLVTILEPLAKEARPFLIICDDIMENVNTMLVMNTLQGAIRCCVVKGIDFGDGRRNLMEDIATSVGAFHFCVENGKSITDATMADIGMASKVVISRDSTIIYEGAGNQEIISKRVDLLRARLKDPSITDYDRTKFTKRVANLAGGVGIIYAGGASEAEKMNRKATIDDSILASKSALAEGCAPGGGYVYLKASLEVKKDKAFWKSLTGSEKEGAEIVFSSLPCVMKTVADNAGGIDPAVVLYNIENYKGKKSWAYNAKTRKFGDLMDEGVLDSAKALRIALENSVSAASMILLIDCLVLDEPTNTTVNPMGM